MDVLNLKLCLLILRKPQTELGKLPSRTQLKLDLNHSRSKHSLGKKVPVIPEDKTGLRRKPEYGKPQAIEKSQK